MEEEICAERWMAYMIFEIILSKYFEIMGNGQESGKDGGYATKHTRIFPIYKRMFNFEIVYGKESDAMWLVN